MKYYIIRSDGSSIFLQPYSYDFCMHCLLKLLDVSDEKYYLLNFTDTSLLPAVQAESALVAAERITLLELQEQ